MTLSTAYHLLRDVFGFDSFRPPQEEIIARVTDGGDALVVMPTGSGKSLCYQIPAMLRDGTGVVISPLIALMEDQVVALRELGVRAASLHSGLGGAESATVWDELLGGRLDLLYVSPERLLSAGFLDRITTIGVALFAIDEAHCVSMWGHDFRREYLELRCLVERFPTVPRLALTATADPPTRREMAAKLGLEEARLFMTSFDRPNIQYRVQPKTSPHTQLLRLLREEHLGDSGIVYRLSRRKVEQTASWLQGQGFDALPYHAGLGSDLRRQTQRRFVRDEVGIIVATVAFGMGIDKPDVRFVAHLDPPKSFEAYYQETGRAGRDGLPATAFMLFGMQDIVLLRSLIERGEAADERRRVEHLKLNTLLGYCETTRCRRQVLLEYFGEQRAEPCGNCDTCLQPVESWDGTEAAQKALSAVVRTEQRFGQGHIIDVLLGEASDKVRRFGHDRLPTFGVGQDLARNTWRSVLRQMVADGLLSVDIDGYGGLRLAGDARAVLRGERQVSLRHDPVSSGKARTRKSRAALAALQRREDIELFEALREHRLDLARRQNVPPYVIFSDRSLIEMSLLRPQSRGALSAVHGVGAVKLERYGGEFLEIIARHGSPGEASARS